MKAVDDISAIEMELLVSTLTEFDKEIHAPYKEKRKHMTCNPQ